MEDNGNMEITPEEIPVGTVSGNDTGTEKPPQDTVTEPQPVQPAPDMNGTPDTGTDNVQAPVKVEVQQAFDGEEFSRILKEALEDPAGQEGMDGLTQRLDEMITLLTPEEEPEEEEPVVHSQLSVPPSDYTSWNYPVSVTYGITTSTGYSTYVSMEYDSPEAFMAGFEGMEEDVTEGSLQSFYVRYARGLDDDGMFTVLLYDSEAPVTMPEEPEENPAADLLFSHLEGINAYLADMSAADTEYYQATLEYREEMLELQRADTASTIILCVAVFMVAAEIIVSDFIGRIK